MVGGASGFAESRPESSGREIVKSAPALGFFLALIPVPGAQLLGIPLVIAGAKMLSDASVIQHNLAVKELQTRTLSPGKLTHGFVYFQLPREKIAADQWIVHLEVLDLSTREMKHFDFTFPWRKE